ncbi:MAG: hypothetical protein ACLFQK_04025 [Fibrobacterota bacterium]
MNKKTHDRIADLFLSLLNRTNKSRLFVSNGFLFAAAFRYLEKNPEDRVVHIVRDPLTAAPSYAAIINNRKKSALAWKTVPFWNLTPVHTDEMEKEEWSRLTKTEKLCWIWKVKNNYIKKMCSRFPGRCITVRFEDLFLNVDKEEYRQKLLDFARLTSKKEFFRNLDIKQNASGPDIGLSEEFTEAVMRICPEERKTFGYN